MTNSPQTLLLKNLVVIFVFTWVLGFIVRVINDPSRLGDNDPGPWPAYRQLRVVGFIRWLFGYRPVTGPISMIGATVQLAAFLTVGATIVLALVWPSIIYDLYWLPLIILALSMLLAQRFTFWLWDKQQGKK